MELLLRECASYVALAAELRSVFRVTIGLVETLIRTGLNDGLERDMRAFGPRGAEEARTPA